MTRLHRSLAPALPLALFFLGAALTLGQARGAAPPADSARIHELERQVLDLTERLRRLEALVQAPPAARAPAGDDAAALRRAAEAALASEPAPVAAAPTGQTVFRSGDQSLQDLNPEISAIGDFKASLDLSDGAEQKSDATLRVMELAFEAPLDPFSRFKALVEVNEEHGASLAEAYLTRTGIARRMNLTLGTFRLQYGTINRWHEHATDQFDKPLALRRMFGDEGLRGTGVALEWRPPATGRAHHQLQLQVTDGQNDLVFEGNEENRPAWLLRYENFRDLSAETSLAAGVTYLQGRNDTWAMDAGDPERRDLDTRAWCFELTLHWEPPAAATRRALEWRTEFYQLDHEVLRADGLGVDEVDPWGFTTYVQRKVNLSTWLGVRYDHYAAEAKDWADGSSTLVSPTGGLQRAITPYVTWDQSEFVRYRLQYGFLDSDDPSVPDERQLLLQVSFAAGPHRHDRY